MKLWDAATGQETATLKGHTYEVWSVAFSPDGKRIASASLDNTAKLWDARPWTPELKAEQEALGLLRFLCAKRPGKEPLIERIRGDATIQSRSGAVPWSWLRLLLSRKKYGLPLLVIPDRRVAWRRFSSRPRPSANN